jgi:hypothetical protein
MVAEIVRLRAETAAKDQVIEAQRAQIGNYDKYVADLKELSDYWKQAATAGLNVRDRSDDLIQTLKLQVNTCQMENHDLTKDLEATRRSRDGALKTGFVVGTAAGAFSGYFAGKSR